MDTSYYHNFIMLVQTGNMTQAAELLHITQPALSKQLKYLEAEFGTPLLHIKRGQRGSNLQLTDAGKIFYEKAQQLCSIEESTYNAVKQLNSKVEGTLKIAASASRSTSLIQETIPSFSSKYPSVRFEIYEGLMSNVTEQLISGRAEIGICNEQMVDLEKFDIIHIQDEDLYALFRTDVFWTNREKESLTWLDIRSCPLSLSGGSVRMLIQSPLTDLSSLNVVSVTTTRSSAIEWAAESARTVAIVPMDAKEVVPYRKMTRLLLPEFSGMFRKAFITVKGHSLTPVAEQFIDYYKANL